jgi:subtilisin family serine protease
VDERPELLRRLGRPAARDQDWPDDDGDGILQPVAGHGTFIGGVIERMAPGCKLGVGRVLTSVGDGSAWSIARRIAVIARNGFEVDGDGFAYEVHLGARSIVNLSFSGYAPGEMACLTRVIQAVSTARRTVFVASAGNDATTRPAFPACVPGVVGVGAIGPYGPAMFTNGGEWIRACAPGVDVVSTMFREWDGILTPQPGSFDPDEFRGWARWSGTSFAAPYVVGALAREMLRSGCTAAEAVERVVDAPWLMRIPGLGTVVNAL